MRNPDGYRKVVMVMGPTAGLVDEALWYPGTTVFRVTGTTRGTPTAGGTKTVFVLEPKK
jgi:hypothetical protein